MNSPFQRLLPLPRKPSSEEVRLSEEVTGEIVEAITRLLLQILAPGETGEVPDDLA